MDRTNLQIAADNLDADLASIERKIRRVYESTGSNAFFDALTDVENARFVLQTEMHEEDRADLQ